MTIDVTWGKIREHFIQNYSHISAYPQGLISSLQPMLLSMGLMILKSYKKPFQIHDYQNIYKSSSLTLKKFIEHAPAKIALLSKNLNYISASPQWCEANYLFNEKSDLINQNYFLSSACKADSWKKILNNCLKGDFFWNEDYLWVHPNGHHHWLYWEIQPWYESEQEIGGLILFCENITQHHTMKQQTTQLAQDKSDLENFAYICPHDLRGHLRSISSFITLIEEHNFSKIDNDTLLYLHYIKEAIEGMKAIIHNSLLYPRLTQESLPKEFVHTGAIIKEILNNLGPLIKQKSALIKVDPLPIVYVNKISLIQVFTNLINNALKYCKTKPCIRISGFENNTECVFQIQDNGIGISEEHQSLIFENLYQIHQNQNETGNGLGLSFCKKIVEHHQGKIFVESKKDHGSTFYIKFPLAPSFIQAKPRHQSNMIKPSTDFF